MKNRPLTVCVLFILLVAVGLPAVGELFPNPIATPPNNQSNFLNTLTPTPVAASEEENVDSFNVHPANRWTDSNDGYTATVENSILNCTDKGDGSGDSYTLDRSLSKLDSKVYIRFRFTTNGTVGDTSNNVAMYLYGTTLGTSHVSLIVRNITQDSYVSESLIRFVNTDGTVIVKTLTGDERLHTDTWYIFYLKYNTLESELEYTLYFGNQSKIWAYDYYDLDSTIPQIFAEETLNLRIYTALETTNYYQQTWWDYVDAPFKEREWSQTTAGSDSDWLFESWHSTRIQDDISAEYSKWQLVVPYLDFFSGSMRLEVSTIASLVNNDKITYYMVLYGVDGDDGNLHAMVYFGIELASSGGAGGTSTIWVQDGNTVTKFSYTVASLANVPKITFTLSLSNDRSNLQLKIRGFLDDTDSTTYKDGVVEFDVSSFVTDPSSEFVIETSAFVDQFNGDTEASFIIEDFDFKSRNIFLDFLAPIVGGASDLLGNIITGIFTIIGRFLAGVFKIVGDIIVAAVAALEPLLNAIDTAIVTMQTALDGAIGLVQTAVDGLVAWIQAIAGDILALIGDFIDDGITHMLTIIATIIGLLAAIGFALYDGLFEDVFGFAEAPDLLALMYQLGVGAIQLVIGLIAFIPAFATNLFRLFDLIPAIGLFIILVLPCFQSDSLGEWFCNALHNAYFDITFDLRPFGLGFHIPFVIPWLIISMATIWEDAIYAGFF